MVICLALHAGIVYSPTNGVRCRSSPAMVEQVTGKHAKSPADNPSFPVDAPKSCRSLEEGHPKLADYFAMTSNFCRTSTMST